MNPEDERLTEQARLGFDADDSPEEGTDSGCLTYLATLAVALLSMGGGIVLTILALFPLAHNPLQELAAVQAACWLLLRGLALQLLVTLVLRLLQFDRSAAAMVPGIAFLGVMVFLLSLLLFFT
jgi:hypothetical protein